MTHASLPAANAHEGSAAAAARRFARKIIPQRWRARHHRRREETLIAGWYRDWQVLRDAAPRSSTSDSRDCLLIPSDTRTFSGGKGDEAMTVAIIEALREAGYDGRIHALCETEAASAAARSLGCEPFTIRQDERYLKTFDRWLETHRPRCAIGIGADSIDGAYGVVGPAGLLTVLDLAAARGCRALVSGFSVRDQVCRALAPFFSRLRPDVRLNVRDPISLRRLREHYGREGRLVADTAFVLEPQTSPRLGPLTEWIRERRAAGRLVVAFNVHPMLFAAGDENGRNAFVGRLASAIRDVSGRRRLAWALVAHDFRPGDADAILLEPLARDLATLGEDVRAEYSTELSAGELKAASALFDAVISARMHLAIASLGSGTPVLGIVYQGKFEGLFELLELPEWLLCGPQSSGEELATRFDRFFDNIPSIRRHIELRKEDVRLLSRSNFEALDEET